MSKIKDRTPALFKFLSHDYAETMLKGDVYISDISDFRNTDKHKLTVGDAMEGITNYISCNEIKQIVVNDHYIYCTTTNFISDSLFWAQKNNKECCVMITSPQDFFDKINRDSPDIEFCGSAICSYKPSKTFDFNLYHEVSTNHITRLNTCLIKELKYAPQLEYRAIWKPKTTPEKNILLNSDISKHLIKIHYSKINEDEFKLGKPVTIKVFRHKGPPTILQCGYPHKILTPSTFSIDSTRYLGFSFFSNRLSYINVESADMGMYSVGNHHTIGINAIANISHIEFE